ncbi:MAG: membrane protein insertase YidC, partial [Syntrophales bacterium LBB04]|nr:membrane protein insertase YidC [Syntrophales bacterium LBB04]
MDKKSILAIVLSLCVLYIYQIFFVKPYPKKPPDSNKNVTAVTDKSPNRAPSPSPLSPVLQIHSAPSGAVSLQQKKGLDDKNISIETDEYSAIFSSRGASLKSVKLKKYREAIDKKSAFIELVNVKTNMPAPFTASFTGDLNIPDDAIYEGKLEASASQNNNDPKQITFTLEYPSIVKIEKIYRFYPGKFNIDLEVRVSNLSANTVNQASSLNWYEFVDPQKEADKYGHEGPVSLVAKSIERDDVKKLTQTKALGPDVSWAGF